MYRITSSTNVPNQIPGKDISEENFEKALELYETEKQRLVTFMHAGECVEDLTVSFPLLAASRICLGAGIVQLKQIDN